MLHTLRRRFGALGGLFTILLGVASVFGQSATANAQPAGGTIVQRLSVDEAVKLALEQNLSLQVQRLNPQLQDLSIAQAKAGWTPTLTTTMSNTSATRPSENIFTASNDSRFAANVNASQLLPWGGNYNVTWNNSRASSNSAFDKYNPSLSSGLSGTYTQPFLRNFKIDATRQQLQVSKKNREMSDVQLKQTVLATVRAVKSAYWDLAYAFENLKVQQQSLDIARESLRNNKSRVDIGTMAPIDIIQAEAEVARNEEAVIIAETQIARATDTFRQIIYDPKTPDFWRFTFELTDQPTFQATTIDVEAAVRTALEKRTDLTNARKNLETTEINLKYYRNQTLPDVNVQAAYGLTAQGGTVKQFDDSVFPPALLSATETSYASTVRKMFSNDFHNWSVAVQVAYPIGRSTAEAGLARAQVSYQQQQLQLRSSELSVAAQVREAARALNTNRKRVDVTRVSRELAERRLQAQQKKFQAGMNTNFEVIQAQRDLAQARNAELQAILDYNRSLVDFEIVQEAPLGGGGISLQ